MILILTTKDDIVSDLVVLRLGSLGEGVLRLNTEDPFDISIELDDNGQRWSVVQGLRCASSSDTTGVWYRRPGPKSLRSTPEIQDFVDDQWTCALKGLSTIGSAIWINDPFLTVAAENKILQLRTALQCGFRVSNTVITNEASRVGSFYAASGRQAVVKSLSSPWLQSSERFVFTSPLTENTLPGDEEAALAPFIAQKLLSPKTDIRVTVVGDTVLAAKIEADTLDWRLSEHTETWSACCLPAAVEKSCLRLCRALGLVFGAIDLIYSEDQYYFIEINPNGEWAWIEHQTSLDISGAIAQALRGSNSS